MSPYFLLSLLIGGMYGAAFHAWQGQSLRDVLYYLGVSVVGFSLGNLLAQLIGWQFFMIGPLHLVEASLVAWLALFIAKWLHI